ncbi:hypothetical protein EVAR_27933_1 [Eumeta japonica]|uniref:Amino acid permease N-terminal domain-containing protein n=1 Tax=Eumeta variegata TaxID=151549 RepID=A0A4C1UVK0_EUMVA|nr:hypothetical protein EVAR_27933_1 [Eumeta japonica]
MENEKHDSAEATEDSEGSGVDSDDPLTVDTKYGKSFRHFTREVLPRLDNYRNVLSLHAAPRPTLDELHNASLSRKWRCDLCIVCVECLGRRMDVETVMLESGVV